MENSKYIVRPDDFCIFEIDESNGCYRTYDGKRFGGNRQTAYKHFSYENLVEGYGFFPIDESEIPHYRKKHDFEIGFMSWQCRNDGHGEPKGGTRGEYLDYLERVKIYQAKKSEKND